MLSFYYIVECWNESGNKFVIPDDGKVITKKKHGWDNTCYGKKWINSNDQHIHKWTFYFKDFTNWTFGFVAECIDHDADFLSSTEITNYAFTGDGDITINGAWDCWKEIIIKENNIMAITLDLVEGTISYNINDEGDTLVHEHLVPNEDTKYKIAVSILEQNDQMIMAKYECNVSD